MHPLRVITDSRYVYDGATVHLRRRFTLGRQVSNLDLWQQLREVMLSRTVLMAFRHVYSHVGIVGNERADDLANAGRLGHRECLQFLRDCSIRQLAPPVVLRPSRCHFAAVWFVRCGVSAPNWFLQVCCRGENTRPPRGRC